MAHTLKVALAQTAPVWLDKAGTIENDPLGFFGPLVMRESGVV